MKFKIEEKLIF